MIGQRKTKRNNIKIPLLPLLYLTIFLLWASKFNQAGCSSTPANLVNLYTNSDKSNSTPTTDWHRSRANPKLHPSDRSHKSITTPSSDNSGFEDLPSDLIPTSNNNNNHNSGPLDYSYHDEKPITTNVLDCKGRLRLTGSKGFITDGPGFYSTNLQCIWLIDSGKNNATIRIQIHQFNTECNYDYLYIFDGDSIYSPLVAALSGDMKDFTTSMMDLKPENMISSNNNNNGITLSNDKTDQVLAYNQQTPSVLSPPTSQASLLSESRPIELKTYSGKAFVYFHSDTAQSMPGFHMTYSIDSCSLDCSNRGDCNYTTLKCICNQGYHGDGCQFISCPNSCTSIQNGICENNVCICSQGYYGPDCSMSTNQQIWINQRQTISNGSVTDNTDIPARAFHQAVVLDNIMYVIGGKSRGLSNSNMGIRRKKSTSTIFSFNLDTKIWTDLNIIRVLGEDHLPELIGHSVAAKGNKIFIFGGMTMDNSVVDYLSVFDTKTNSLTKLIEESKPKLDRVRLTGDIYAPLSVIGHTAIIIDSHMYVFLGYNPILGYLDIVQKFNLADNTWSVIPKRGSSIPGCLGHTTNYDPDTGLIYLYGGHNAHKINNLYAFDPVTEVWTFLQPGTSHRYYHTSVIVNKQLIILGGNSYNISHQSDKCYQQSYITYDLACSTSHNSLINKDSDGESNNSSMNVGNDFIASCGRKCWHTIEESEPSFLKRLGHSTVHYKNQLILYGGFNGILMNDLRIMNISNCESYSQESSCLRPKIALSCYWDSVEGKCFNQLMNQFNASLSTSPEVSTTNCTRDDSKMLQHICKARETCTDCLNTNLGCVWCGLTTRCNYNKCRSPGARAILDSELCHSENVQSSLIGINLNNFPMKDVQVGRDLQLVTECKRIENCYLCNYRPQCSWQNDACAPRSTTFLSADPAFGLVPGHESSPQDDMGDMYDGSGAEGNTHAANNPSSSSKMQLFTSSNSSLKNYRRVGLFHRSLFATVTDSLNQSPLFCDVPCSLRASCNACTTTKCIWCSTTEQCIDSSAYFAYHAIGQCMHYVAHMMKCPIATCAGIETCDKCLTNPKCGWLNDISNSGKGRCIEGTSSGPIFGNISTALEELQNRSSMSTELSTLKTPQEAFIHQNWFYTSCPSCQCNGHSYCKSANSSVCSQPCQDYTEGQHCERCIQGYYGDPINGGVCKPCECNGHASTCHRETGKCYCSTKGIVGHTCNRCDDQNHYLGDLSAQGNGTCYYSLTTDFQYTFNMSKPEDHFYNDINFINVPLRKDSDLDFTIACSRLALVNITSGSFKNRKPIHTSLECGSFRLRFPHVMSESNYSFFVHVYNFQTPFILQIAFSQHRTLYLPQFFFTFSSCFLFFFALSGIVWKLKHEYDIYLRRQRQFIEMEQMASRPFSTVLLEMFKPRLGKDSELEALRPPPEPTPISFEPCFGNNVGVMSLFVQLPGRPNLAIGSALVTLNEEFPNSCDDNNANKKRNSDKQKDQQVSV